jgi:uncharacterized protein
MKKFILLPIFLSVIALQGFAQENKAVYDEALAKQLGADELGMRTYVIAFLKSGPVKLADSLQMAELQKAHLKNIARMIEAGKLITAGPFLDNQSLRGIYIFDVTTVEEARELTTTDPAIKAGTLVMELHPWYGSAALKVLPELHKAVQKKGFGE